MRNWILLLSCMMLTMGSMSGLAYAESTVKTVEFPIGFLNNVQASTNLTDTINFNSPDGLSQIHFIKISGKIDSINPNTKLFMSSNFQSCGPSNGIKIPNNVVNYEFSFDCSGTITEEGQYQFTIYSTKQASNLFGDIHITYSNNPVFDPTIIPLIANEVQTVREQVDDSLQVFGTDYHIGEGKQTIFLQLLEQGKSVTGAMCMASVLEQENKTKIIIDSPMIEADDGVYWLDVQVESYGEGVYPVTVECQYIFDSVRNTADGFNIVLGDVDKNNYIATHVSDGIDHKINDDKIAPNNNDIEIYYQFNNLDLPSTNGNISSVVWEGKWDVNYGAVGDLTANISIFNFTAGAYEVLPNIITESGTDITVTNSINKPFGDYLNASNGTIIRIFNTGALESSPDIKVKITTDYLYIEHLVPNGTFVNDIRGGGEIHLINATKTLTNLTVDLQPVIDNIESHNTTTNLRFNSIDSFLSGFQTNVENLFASIEVGLIGNTTLIQSDIASVNNTDSGFPSEINGTQQFYEFIGTINNTDSGQVDLTPVIDAISNMNDTLITHDQNVTVKVNALGIQIISVNDTVITTNNTPDISGLATQTQVDSLGDLIGLNFTNSFANQNTIISNTNDIPNDVWTHGDRTLTELNLTNVTLVGNVSMTQENLDDISRSVYNWFYRADALPEQDSFFETLFRGNSE